jgi:hypothetical protein
MPTGSKAEALAEEARFVFIGTVQKLGAATMDDVPIDDRTAVVRVDEVIHAPDVLTYYAGHDITVQVGGRKRVQAGQQAKFYTNGWLFGDSVAVESIDHEDVKRPAAAASREIGDPVRRLGQRDLQGRFADAALVVSGRVTSVRVPDDVVAARSARGVDAPAVVGRISEHDPDWRIADVKVDEVHKGTHPRDTVSIRFPSSEDVMWHDAPKFHPGQEGFFMLHKTDEAVGKKAAVARGAAVQDKGEFVAPRAADFQPFSVPGGVRQLIESPAEDVVPPPSEAPREVPRRKAGAKPASPRRRKAATKRASPTARKRRS